MRIKLHGKKYKYQTEYFKLEDEFKVKLPSYMMSNCGKVYHEKEWKDCIFHVHNFSKKLKIFISPGGVYKDGMSDIGKVNSQGFVDIFEISGFKRFLIILHDFIYFKKITALSVVDRASRIKTNLKLILLAFIGATIYYLINHIFDGFLQDLINESNFVQSLIVFLSLSSIINIFHPFTFKKSWSIEEINELIEKKQAKLKKQLTDKK